MKTTLSGVEDPICLCRSCPKAPLQYQLSQHSHHEHQTAKATVTEACRSELQSQSPKLKRSHLLNRIYRSGAPMCFSVCLPSSCLSLKSFPSGLPRGKVQAFFSCFVFYVQYRGECIAAHLYKSISLKAARKLNPTLGQRGRQRERWSLIHP